jgi:tripartite-type tricarboxylate transporter receptor subunit TctC
MATGTIAYADRSRALASGRSIALVQPSRHSSWLGRSKRRRLAPLIPAVLVANLRVKERSAMYCTRTIVASALLVTLTGAAHAQDWPTRPITLVVPFAPGGGIDVSVRIQAQHMSETLGQTIVIENVGGAAGTTGSLRVAKAAPDGYTLLIGNSGTHAYSQSLYKRPPYNAVADFEPVGLVSDSPRILIARKDLPANNLQEFIAYVKANQSTMQFGSAGVGAGTHLPCVLLNMAMGVHVTHVPYRGAGPVMQDLIGGRIDYMCDTIQTGAQQAKQGSVKGIAVMAPKRVPIIADLATTAEQGLPGVEASVWNGFFFPKGTPAPIVRKLHQAMSAMLDDQALRKRLEDLGLEIVAPERRSPEYLAKFLPEEIALWGKVITTAGISMD